MIRGHVILCKLCAIIRSKWTVFVQVMCHHYRQMNCFCASYAPSLEANELFLCKLCAIIRSKWTVFVQIMCHHYRQMNSTKQRSCSNADISSTRQETPLIQRSQLFIAVVTGLRHWSLPTSKKKSCILLKIHFNIILLPSISRCST